MILLNWIFWRSNKDLLKGNGIYFTWQFFLPLPLKFLGAPTNIAISCVLETTFFLLSDNLKIQISLCPKSSLQQIELYINIFSICNVSILWLIIYVIMFNKFPSTAGIIWYVFRGIFPPSPLPFCKYLWSNAHKKWYFKCFPFKRKLRFLNWCKSLS